MLIVRILLLLLVLRSDFAIAQDARSLVQAAKRSYDFGLDFGTLIPSRNGLVETVPGWGGRVSLPTGKGIFEPHFYLGRGRGIIYKALGLDLRMDLELESLYAHFLLGAHLDQFEQAYPPQSKPYAGGWHYGGGVSMLLAGPVLARFDFRHRFSPGQEVQITLGLTYRMTAEGGQE